MRVKGVNFSWCMFLFTLHLWIISVIPTLQWRQAVYKNIYIRGTLERQWQMLACKMQQYGENSRSDLLQPRMGQLRPISNGDNITNDHNCHYTSGSIYHSVGGSERRQRKTFWPWWYSTHTAAKINWWVTVLNNWPINQTGKSQLVMCITNN